jgi:hypothetical protein
MASLLVPGLVRSGQRLAAFSGRWLACDGLLLTAIAMPNVKGVSQLGPGFISNPYAHAPD